ncbi:Frag1/DRAM/Sfk1 family-domain-containing protein [Hyaloscypha finlandica]|nr:Frag1/DRAM/Sfk1 family-domain-containing protein [Hyaloscypha finlandica]
MPATHAHSWGSLIYVIIPIFSGCVWLAMLLGMLLWWTVEEGSPYLALMRRNQTIAYISDIGAHSLQPLFIAMGTVSVVSFDIVFIAERWLRHRGKLAPNTSWFQKGLSICAMIAAIVGAIGLILLTCLNDLHHDKAHDACLVIFIAGYIVSAIFICWEYQRLGIHHRQHRILRISFWIKLTFIFTELGLAIAFGVLADKDHYNAAAVCEWVIALIYAFYVWSFAIDFIPAVRTRHYASKETELEMATAMEQESRQRGWNGSAMEQGTYNGRVGQGVPEPARNF